MKRIFLVALLVTFCKSSLLKAPENPKFCYAALDIVQVQDMTSSFDDLWKRMATQVGHLMNIVSSTHENSYFGIVTFGDKNIVGTNLKEHKQHYLGYETDYCAHVDIPLSKPDSNRMIDMFYEYHKKFQGGGGDWPEASLEAVYRTLISDRVGWRPDYRESDKGVARIVVLVTDATSHLPGDVKRLTNVDLPPFQLPDHIPDENHKCRDIEYPSFKQVADMLKKKNVSLIVLAAPGGVYSKTTGQFIPSYSLAKEGSIYHHEHGLREWFKDKFNQADYPDVVVEQLDPKMEVYAQAFEAAITAVNALRCRPPQPPKAKVVSTPDVEQYPASKPTSQPDQFPYYLEIPINFPTEQNHERDTSTVEKNTKDGEETPKIKTESGEPVPETPALPVKEREEVPVKKDKQVRNPKQGDVPQRNQNENDHDTDKNNDIITKITFIPPSPVVFTNSTDKTPVYQEPIYTRKFLPPLYRFRAPRPASRTNCGKLRSDCFESIAIDVEVDVEI